MSYFTAVYSFVRSGELRLARIAHRQVLATATFRASLFFLLPTLIFSHFLTPSRESPLCLGILGASGARTRLASFRAENCWSRRTKHRRVAQEHRGQLGNCTRA